MNSTKFYWRQLRQLLPVRNMRWLFQVISKSKEYLRLNIRIAAGSIVIKSRLEGENYIGPQVTVTCSSIGRFTYLSENTKINNAVIGRFCSIGPNFNVGLGMHPKNFVSTHPFFYSSEHISHEQKIEHRFDEYRLTTIGNDVWIGANVILVDGVKIADGAIVAAGAVVTKDVGPYEIVGGVPAKFISKRFPDSVIIMLLNSKWWDKTPEELRANAKSFCRYPEENQFSMYPRGENR